MCLKDRSPPTAAREKKSALMRALFFSRAAVGGERSLRHIGVYAFHVSVLGLLCGPRSELSMAEDLEQLTWMERGEEIGVELARPQSPRLAPST